MLTRTDDGLQINGEDLSADWRTELAEAITDPDELIRRLKLPEKYRQPARRAAKLFPLKVPARYIDLMEPGNIADPLLRQVLPLGEEFHQRPDYLLDPLEESEAQPFPGLLHKYKNRVLLITTGACAIHCRYCFRRNFSYSDQQISSAQWPKLLDYLMNNTHIEEVILSGGDPLMLADHKLRKLLLQLEKVAHLQTIRIHSRLPVFIPSRLSKQFYDIFAQSRLSRVLVLHINHAREISEELVVAGIKTRENGFTLLNQAVLLRGVNDNAETQIKLSKNLFRAGILPYYLHLPDRVTGTSHFAVDHLDHKRLMNELRANLPGYLVPRLVREHPGEASKTLIM